MRYYLDAPPSEIEFALGDSANDAVIALPAMSDWLHRLDWIVWSFDAKPRSAARLLITDITNNEILLGISLSLGGIGPQSALQKYGLLNFQNLGFHSPLESEIEIRLQGNGSNKSLSVQHR